MRVLLTGVAGLVGSHLAEHLLDRGDEVVGFDNFVSGSRRNIAALEGRDPVACAVLVLMASL